MKYTVPQIAKAVAAATTAALGAAVVAAGGPDLSVLSVGEILGALGAGLTAGGATFGTPNRSTDPVESPADKVVNGVQAVIEAKAQADAELERVKAAVTDVADDIPVLGPLVTAALNQL